MAPAHPHATLVAVYPALLDPSFLFFLILFLILFKFSYATFSDLCQLETSGLDCEIPMTNCDRHGSWICQPRTREKWACHVRRVLRMNWTAGAYEETDRRWTYGRYEKKCSAIADVKLKGEKTASRRPMCSELVRPNAGAGGGGDGFDNWESFIPITGGWVRTVYSKNQQQSSKHLICINYDTIQMRLDGNSELTPVFNVVDVPLQTGNNTLSLTRRSRYDNKNGETWSIAALKTFYLNIRDVVGMKSII